MTNVVAFQPKGGDLNLILESYALAWMNTGEAPKEIEDALFKGLATYGMTGAIKHLIEARLLTAMVELKEYALFKDGHVYGIVSTEEATDWPDLYIIISQEIAEKRHLAIAKRITLMSYAPNYERMKEIATEAIAAPRFVCTHVSNRVLTPDDVIEEAVEMLQRDAESERVIMQDRPIGDNGEPMCSVIVERAMGALEDTMFVFETTTFSYPVDTLCIEPVERSAYNALVTDKG